jgi:hypothetical protein
MNVLMGYPQEAFELLFERFRTMEGPEELYRSPWVLYSLCRTGSRFLEAIIPWLTSSQGREKRLALAGAEALGRCLWKYAEKASREEFLNDVRNWAKWPRLRRRDLGEQNLVRLSEGVAGLLTDASPEIREGAIRTLGRLRVRTHLPTIISSLNHPESATRLAAILALSQFDDPAGEEVLRKIAETGANPERSAAKNALSRIEADRCSPSQYVPTEREVRLSSKIRGDKKPITHISLNSVLMFALTELRDYDEREIHHRLAGCCWDHAIARRNLIEQGLMVREEGVYRFTLLGRAAWRVEQFILDRYLRRFE